LSRSKPKVIADENVPKQVVTALETMKFDVLWIADVPQLRGMKNSLLLDLAIERNNILLTCDSDFLSPTKRWKIIYLHHTGDPTEMANLIKNYIMQAVELIESGKAEIVSVSKKGTMKIS
jgi:predicted nuclease of predicted toxin-antitoxin system